MAEFLWNMDDGFVDALVRGWRSGFLSDLEYTNLKEGELRSAARATRGRRPSTVRSHACAWRARSGAPPRV